MPQADTYAPGEVLIDTLSKMSRQIILSFARGETQGEVRPDLAQYIVKSLDKLVLTAPSTTIDRVMETLIREWENLLAIAGEASQELNVEQTKLLITDLCLALIAAKDKFTPADLEKILSLLAEEASLAPVQLPAGDLAEFYQATIGSLAEEISTQLFGF